MRDRSVDYRFRLSDDCYTSNLLEYLYMGGNDEDTIRILANSQLDYLRTRKDCSDFRAAYIAREWYSYEDRLPLDLRDTIVRELLDYPYEDCGGHNMCTWTENHRLYTAGTEYMVAAKCPERIFGDGKDAMYHLAHAKRELNNILTHIHKYGFAEWGSNNYYSETMAGLCNLVQFVSECEINKKARKALLMLIEEIMSQTVESEGEYIYNPACGRAYVDNKAGSTIGNYLGPQIRAIRGEKVNYFKEKEGCMILLLEAKDESGNPIFEVPDNIRLLPDKRDREVCLKQGINLDDYKNEGLDGYSTDNVRLAMEAGAISDYRVIRNTARYLRETGMISNGMLKNVVFLNSKFLYNTGLLKAFKKLFTIGFDGTAMEMGNTYTYAAKNYSLSAAYDYRVGLPLYQQNSLAINIAKDISLFTTHPYCGSSRGGSPSYWIGSATAPRAVAYKNFAAEIYDIRHAGLGLKMSHLFFPCEKFSKTDLSHMENGILLGSKAGVNVCVFTNPDVHFVPIEISKKEDRMFCNDIKIPTDYFTKEYDLVNNSKGYHYYFFIVDSTASFDDFCKTIFGGDTVFEPLNGKLKYKGIVYEFSYKGPFKVNDEEFIPEFERPGRDL